MKRVLPLLVPLLLAATAGADTILIGDLCRLGNPRAGDESFAIGIPYLIARTLNTSNACEAVTPAISPAQFARLYDAAGRPTPEGVRGFCEDSGASGCLLGHFRREGETAAVTFTVCSARGETGQVFRVDAQDPRTLQALAEYAALKLYPKTDVARTPRLPPELLGGMSRALRALRQNDRTAAAAETDRMLGRFPDSPDLCCLRGRIEAARRQPYAALRFLNQARNADPHFALPALEEGKVWLSLERRSLAEKAFDDASRTQTTLFQAPAESGALTAQLGDCAAARGTLRRALACRPRD
ncbi:MAG: hypothetical protein NT045_07480, partial [Candidatus Aureabacteria bacterium]|nr:hypothetical protein [Candidatus Auribacterota bacterium]